MLRFKIVNIRVIKNTNDPDVARNFVFILPELIQKDERLKFQEWYNFPGESKI
jgi:hypothetical protein